MRVTSDAWEVALLAWIACFLAFKAVMLRRDSALGKWLSIANWAMALTYAWAVAYRLYPAFVSHWAVGTGLRVLVALSTAMGAYHLFRTLGGWPGIRDAAFQGKGPGDERA